jgi:hypothetical protein
VLAALRGAVVAWHQRSVSSPAYFSAAKTRLAPDNSSVDNHTFVHSGGALVFAAVGLAFEVAFEVEIGLEPLGPELEPGAMTVDFVVVAVVSVAEAEASC